MSALSPTDTINTTASLVVDDCILSLSEEWIFEPSRIIVIPGTWCKPPRGCDPHWLALIACPHCKQPCILHDKVSEVMYAGKVKPSYICAAIQKDGRRGCGFHRNIVLDRWSKKPLWACAVDWLDPKTGSRLKGEIIYVSADTREEARFELGYPPNMRVIDIGKPIGFFQKNERDDRNLLAD